ncbi:monooxygenase [Geobacter luticola]|uniref:Monooxygenase n=2 Tax=Geobacterales TaxID=3031668 RepID=A0ABS5SAX4_9BACT|nr:monooxygenase [Geomobilimonas luticola]
MFVVTAVSLQAQAAETVAKRGPILVQFDFSYKGPFGKDMTAAMTDLAKSITQEPGFIWKIWTENEKAQEAGGIYLFEDEKSAQAYINKHSARLKMFGINQVNAKVFDVNAPLTEITKGTLRAR